MASVKNRDTADRISADEIDNHDLYKPGPDSIGLLKVRVHYGTEISRLIPFAVKLALICNDALCNHSADLGVSGFFFCSTESYALENLTDGANVFHAGPRLFFASFNLSAQEKKHWNQASVRGKLKLCSLLWKNQRLSAYWPVLPIWTSPRSTQKPQREVPGFAVPFPREDKLQELGIGDPTRELSGLTSGAFVDVIEGCLFFTAADDFRLRCTKRRGDVNKGEKETLAFWSKMQAGKGGGLTVQGEWLRSYYLPEADPIAALIKAAANMFDAQPDRLVTYQRAHSWSPLAEFHLAVDPAVSQIPPTVHTPRNPLMDAFHAGEPVFANKERRGEHVVHGRGWTADEDEIALLLDRGYDLDVVVDYLPYDRTVGALYERRKAHLKKRLRASKEG